MVRKKTKKLFFNVLYWIGISAVVSTHVAILAMGIPQDMLGGHAMINLVAAALIGTAYFNKQ